jgi:ribulose-5-phosphate 4-epimerase/fuculose-1-phosphate aldolase
MTLTEPYPSIDEILASIGEGGRRVATMDAGEGAAGNISVCVGWPLEIRRQFPIVEPIELPVPAPHLAGHIVIVTGSGRRLRDIATNPVANLGAVSIALDGMSATLRTAPTRLFERLTSEWNSHLAVHDDTVARTGTNFHAVVHAQPPHITYLSHLPAYRDEAHFNRIQPGITRDELRRQLGEPSRVWQVRYHDQTVWSYRFDGRFCLVFHVGITPQGVVEDTSYGPDAGCEGRNRVNSR